MMSDKLKELKAYAENMDRLVKAIIRLFEKDNSRGLLEGVWILSTTPSLGNLTLATMGKTTYDDLHKLLNGLCKSPDFINIKKNLKCFESGIESFYDSLGSKLSEITGRNLTQIAQKAKTQAKKLIESFRNTWNGNVRELNDKPEISVWACKRKSENQEDRYEAIFYLTETEEEIMDFRAFYVNDTELAKFLTTLVEKKKQ